jgi:hypothetical protein
MKHSTSKRTNPYLALAMMMVAIAIVFGSCTPKQQNNIEANSVAENFITEQEVLDAQNRWGDGIVQIGKVYAEGGDYVLAASDHIDRLYGYDMGIVLFKPTLASEKQFRTNKEGALSYFVGKNPDYPEDHGFAIKPWSAVRWESVGIKIIGNMAVCMGNYYFTPAIGGEEVKVEYTFSYTKNENGDLKIILHGSHLPYSPTGKH